MIHKAPGRHRLGAAAFAVACTALLFTGCTSSAPPPAANPPAGPVPQVAPTYVSQQARTSPAKAPPKPASQPVTRSALPTPTPSPPPGVPPVLACATASLRGSIGPATGNAGTFYYPVQFTNTSASACTLFGYPGVSVVASPSGSQIGPQAVRIGTFSPQQVTLAAGGVAHATMQLPDPGVLGTAVCVPKIVHWLRVYPPGQFTPLYISVPATSNPVQICTGKHLGNTIPLGIFVVMPASSGP
jgi:hypothetical protein